MGATFEKMLDAGLAVTEAHSLANYCTYRVGGPARVFCEISDTAELVTAAKIIAENSEETLVVGKGSNLLVADAGFDGVAVKLGREFDFVEIDGTTVNAGGITFLPIVARKSVAAGLTEFEWAVGVPGSIGGAVRMNAGGHGSDMAANLDTATLFDFADAQIHVKTGPELELSYRSSNVTSTQIVLSAKLNLAPGDTDAGSAELSEIVQWRRQHQPGGANAGSVFANPDDGHAAKLIDELGLKGHRVGTASVSVKHANFIQVDADGSANDVHSLISFIQQSVKAAHGIELRCENKLIGFEH